MSDVATSTTTSGGSGSAAPMGVAARAFGVIFSPRETYADVARHPSFVAAAVITLLITIAASFAFLMTEVGKDALFARQMDFIESLNIRVPDQVYDQMEASLARAPYFTAASQLVFTPVFWAIAAGLVLGVFNVILGGEATFRQVFAIVVHGSFLFALQQLFINPLNYARKSMTSPTTLAVFFPFLDQRSFPALLLGGIDLFFIWLIVNQAIGIGVLYKKKTAPIAMTMLGIYVAIVLIVAGVRAALGAS